MRMSLLFLCFGAMAVQNVNAAEETKLPKEFSVTISPGKNHEECIHLKKDVEIAYRFKASQAVPFNIHYHVGKGSDAKVEYAVRMDKIDATESVLLAPIDQHYCWMWSNRALDSITVSGVLAFK